MVRKMLLLVTFLVGLVQLHAQDRTISGKIVDETGNALPGATVTLKGTTKVTVTNIDGAYSLSAPQDGGTIVVTYVGYTSQEIQIGETNTVDINLQPDVQALNEVVVIGYGVQKKSLVTGSIARVDSKDIAASVATRFEQAIQGKTSGMVVVQNSGAPGAGLTIKIRGNSSDRSNSPLYIVDGVKTGGLEYLSPSDIESIEVLKDAASAAIYGSDGGNGVIIITTKKGKKGDAHVEYNYSHGEQSATNLPKVMNSKQYRDYFMEATATEISYKAKPKKSDSTLYKNFSALDPNIGTNWIDEVFRTAPMDEHTVNISGGNEKSTYFLSGSYLTQDGIIGGPKNNFKRYTFRSNIDTEVKSWLSVGSNASYTRFTKKNLNTTNEYGGIINNAMTYEPTLPVYFDAIPDRYINDSAVVAAWNRNAEGRLYSKSEITTGEAWNPLAQIDYTHDQNIQDKIVGDFHANLMPFKGLKITSRIFTDYAYQKTDKFSGYNFYGVDPILKDSNTFVEQSWDRWYKYGIENFATYNQSIGDHNFEIMVGQSYEDYIHEWLYTKNYLIKYNSTDYAYPGAAVDNKKFEIGDQTDDNQNSRVGSYFGRFVYNYKELFMLQGNFRRDGASNFGPNKKYATFPSFSTGVNINKFEFFNNLGLDYISNLKLRFSWGQNGSRQSLSAFPYVTQMQTIYYSDASASGSRTDGAVPGRAANTALRWETSEQYNFGLDFGLFKNALTLSVERYVKSTIDQIATKSDLPVYLGYQDPPYVNSGQIDNKGWEFDLNYKNNFGDLNYDINFNASYLKNEVIDYGVKQGYDGANIGQMGVVNRYDIGQPVWYFYGYKANGIFQTQDEVNNYVNSDGVMYQSKAHAGDVKFVDLPVDTLGGLGDGKIDQNDRTYLGKPMPDWTFGFSLNLEFKGIDASAFFQGVTGNQIYWASFRKDRASYNKDVMWYENRWTGEGSTNKYPRATYNDINDNFRVSSMNVYDGDYLRLKTLTLGYTLPKSITSKILISKLRFYYSGTNLFTWTNYPGTDPEVGMYDSNYNASYGIDKGVYPPTRVHTIGINVVF